MRIAPTLILVHPLTNQKPVMAITKSKGQETQKSSIKDCIIKDCIIKDCIIKDCIIKEYIIKEYIIAKDIITNKKRAISRLTKLEEDMLLITVENDYGCTKSKSKSIIIQGLNEKQ